MRMDLCSATEKHTDRKSMLFALYESNDNEIRLEISIRNEAYRCSLNEITSNDYRNELTPNACIMYGSAVCEKVLIIP